MIRITQDQITHLAPNIRSAYLQAFQTADAVLQEKQVNENSLRVAHFMAQVLHESDGLTILIENMNYSAERLIQVFPNRVTPAEASRLAHHPEDIANKVYGNREDLGNNQDGDGFRFIGRGIMQLTGRDSYTRAGQAIDADLVGTPDLAFDPRFVLRIAVWEWDEKGCNAPADDDNIRRVTRLINGGQNGLASRQDWLRKTKAVWGG
jgi:putative chitinase